MNQFDEQESGYMGNVETDCYVGSAIHDVEVIRETKTNVIARGRRYGRQWFLKGLRKELRDSAVMQRQLQKEFEIHSRLRHPAVPQVVGLENVEGLGLCIVEEWIEGVTLREMLQKENLGSAEKRRLMRDLTETVAYLHSRGIVHRDLKPANVMVRDVGKEVVLIDYGLADTADYVEIKGPAGTPGFISPEQEDSGGADTADDVFSLGVMMRALTPFYKRLANRCTGPLKSRPKDANALLKLIDVRAKKPRIIMGVVATILVIVISALGINRIRSLEKSSRIASEQVSKLSDENARNAALVSSLDDSLSNLNGNLLHAREEILKMTEYENLRRSAISNGCRMLDNLFYRHDRMASADSISDAMEFAAKIAKFAETTVKAIKDYGESLDNSGLTQEDIETVSSTLTNYYGSQYSKFAQKWLKMRSPDQSGKE